MSSLHFCLFVPVSVCPLLFSFVNLCICCISVSFSSFSSPLCVFLSISLSGFPLPPPLLLCSLSLRHEHLTTSHYNASTQTTIATITTTTIDNPAIILPPSPPALNKGRRESTLTRFVMWSCGLTPLGPVSSRCRQD